MDLPPPVDVEAALVEYVTTSCKAAEVEVRHLGVADGLLAGAERVQWSGDACRGRPMLSLTPYAGRVALGRISVRPQLTIRVLVPVADRAIRRGEPVTFAPGLAEIDQVVGGPIRTPGHWIARVDLDAGDPVTASVVRRAPDAHNGDDVVVQLRRGALMLSATGRLLGDGVVGDSVKVLNLATGRAQDGVLIAADRVEIR